MSHASDLGKLTSVHTACTPLGFGRQFGQLIHNKVLYIAQGLLLGGIATIHKEFSLQWLLCAAL